MIDFFCVQGGAGVALMAPARIFSVALDRPPGGRAGLVPPPSPAQAMPHHFGGPGVGGVGTAPLFLPAPWQPPSFFGRLGWRLPSKSGRPGDRAPRCFGVLCLRPRARPAHTFRPQATQAGPLCPPLGSHLGLKVGGGRAQGGQGGGLPAGGGGKKGFTGF